MRVLVVTGIYPPDHGGPASYVPAICNSIIDQGHHIQGVVTLSDELMAEGEESNFPVFRILRQRQRILRLYKVVSLIWRLSRDVDLIYLNGLVLEGVLACKILRRRKVVIKVVGDLVWERAQNAQYDLPLEKFQCSKINVSYEFLKKLQSWYTRKADFIITPSHYMAKIIGLWGVAKDRIQVIHNGIDEEEQGDTCAHPETRYDVVMVGRLIPLKRIDHVIEICVKNGWSLNIIGDGPERQRLEIMAKKTGNGLITFAGSMRKDQVRTAITAGKILVLNSVHETFPHVLLEAKSVGVAVIATNVGGVPEIVRDGVDGVLIIPGDNVALENAIQRLLDNPGERHRLSMAGKDQVKLEFNWKNLSAQTVEALELVGSATNV